MDLEFPGNIHIKTLCSKFQQSFPKFHAAVKKELSLPTVHYHIQHMAKILCSKRPKITENNGIKISEYYNMNIYT